MSDGYVFYRSFYEAIKNLDDENFKKCVVALCEYALNEVYDPNGAVAEMFMIMAKPQVDANSARRRNGTKGGRPPKEEKKQETGKKQVIEAEELANVDAIVLNNSTEWRPTMKMYEEYCSLYPNVDVIQEFRNMRGWSMSNPTRRKTSKGVSRFVNSWLSRCQNSSPRTSRVVVPMPTIFSQTEDYSDYESEDMIEKIKEMQEKTC